MKYVRFLFTNEIFEDKKLFKKILTIILIGILIRLAFMPFTAHNDFLSEHIRVEYILYHKEPFAITGQYLSHYIDAAFLLVSSTLIPEHDQLFKLPGVEGSESTAGISDFFNFLRTKYAFRVIFLLKFPYLLADLFCVFLLLRLVGKKNAVWAIAFWMFNPLSIYTIYIFGRFEIYAVAFLLLAFLFAMREKPLLASFMLGLAIASRSYMLMFIPLFCFLISTKWRTAVLSLLISISPIAIYSIFANLLGSGPFFYKSVPTSNAISSLIEGGFLGLALVPQIKIGSFNLFIIPAIVLLFYVCALIRRERGYEAIIKYSSLIILAYFAFAKFSIHWFYWLSPFFVILFAKIKELRWLVWVIFPIWFIHSALFSDVGAFTLYLFSPLHPEYFGIQPNLSMIIGYLVENLKPGPGMRQFMDRAFLINILRTALTVFLYWIAIRILKSSSNELKTK